MPRLRRKAIIDGVLELTDLDGKRATAVDSLSRGMQQRLGLARVLVHDPKVLILDEPASGLDPRARIEIRELLMELKNMGKTIMISSHILSELEEMCDQVGIIENGRMVFVGTITDIHRRLGIHGLMAVQVSADADRASELISALPQVNGVRMDDGRLIVTLCDGEQTGGIIARTLVEAGIDIVSLVPEKLKLDDAFLQLTKGIVS